MTFRFVLFGLAGLLCVVALFFGRFQPVLQQFSGIPLPPADATPSDAPQSFPAESRRLPAGTRVSGLAARLPQGRSFSTGEMSTGEMAPASEDWSRISQGVGDWRAGGAGVSESRRAPRQTETTEEFQETNTLLNRAVQQLQLTQRQLQERQALLQELEARKQQIAALEKWIVNLRQQMAQHEQRAHQLETRRRQLEGDLKTQQALAASLQGRITQLELEGAQVMRERDRLETHYAQQQAHERDAQRRLEAQVLEKQQLLDRLTTDLTESRTVASRLSDQLVEVRQELQTATDRAKRLERANADLEAGKRQWTKRLEEIRQSHAREVERLNRRSADERKRLKELERELSAGRDSQRKLQEALADVAELKQALAEREVQLKQAEVIIKLLEKERRR